MSILQLQGSWCAFYRFFIRVKSDKGLVPCKYVANLWCGVSYVCINFIKKRILEKYEYLDKRCQMQKLLASIFFLSSHIFIVLIEIVQLRGDFNIWKVPPLQSITWFLIVAWLPLFTTTGNLKENRCYYSVCVEEEASRSVEGWNCSLSCTVTISPLYRHNENKSKQWSEFSEAWCFQQVVVCADRPTGSHAVLPRLARCKSVFSLICPLELMGKLNWALCLWWLAVPITFCSRPPDRLLCLKLPEENCCCTVLVILKTANLKTELILVVIVQFVTVWGKLVVSFPSERQQPQWAGTGDLSWGELELGSLFA